MKKYFLRWVGVFFFLLGSPIVGEDSRRVDVSQQNYERKNRTVVRNKTFYKAGKMELALAGGLMPYDSVVNQYVLGGRATWHIADYYAWEIIDANAVFPSITNFTTSLVSSKGISNLQSNQLKVVAASSFLLSPIYGKVRLFSSAVIYFDIYAAIGIGVGRSETVRVSTTTTNGTPTTSIINAAWDPLFNLGFGFKIFLNSAMGLTFDMRDYLVYTTTYGSKRFRSNFTVFLGLTFFLPTFG